MEKAKEEQRPTGWQPIETAPKDGTQVDLWVKTWNEWNDKFTYQRVANCFWYKGDSFTGSPAGWCGVPEGWRPTHWMSLPEPPKEGE